MATRQNKNLLADDFNNYLEGEINEKLLGNIQGDNIDETKMRNQFITAFKEDANEGMSRDDAMITFLVNIALYGASSASSNKYNIDFKVLTISNLMRCFIFDIYRAILGIQIEVEELDENDVSNALFTNNNPITDYTEKEWTLIANCIRERSILYKHHAKSNLSNEYVCCLILPGMYLIPKKMEISKFACAVFSCVSLSISEVAEARSDEATAEQAIIYMKKVSSLSRNMDMAELKEAMLHVEAIQKVKAIVGYSSSELLDIFVSYQDKETFKRAKILNEANLKRAKGTPKKKYSDLKSSTTNQNKTATTSTKQFVEVNNKVYFQDENGNLKLVNQDS